MLLLKALSAGVMLGLAQVTLVVLTPRPSPARPFSST